MLPTRSGYKFTGWDDTALATTVKYHPGDTYSKNASAILYAVSKSIDKTQKTAATTRPSTMLPTTYWSIITKDTVETGVPKLKKKSAKS